MGLIRQMDAELAALVAAGEVIESPAAVVRELVDNALDAGAGEVSVEIERGGSGRIVVRDDGVGMDRADVELAFQRHATSKLERPEELLRVRSLGFRGEALPSIAAVARVGLRSGRGAAAVEGGGEVDPAEGWLTRWSGGRHEGLEPVAARRGTVVEVEELFFNLPARRKFLGAVAAQAREVDRALRLQALAFPAVGFRLRRDGVEVWRRPVGEDFAARAAWVLGGEDDGLWPLREERAEIGQMEGLVSAPGACRRGRRLQIWVLGRRAIRSEALSTALRRAYGNSCAPGENPLAVLRLELDDSHGIDWNVHPAKQEVRFSDRSRAERGVEAMVAAALSAGSGRRGGNPGGGGAGWAPDEARRRSGKPSAAETGGTGGGGPTSAAQPGLRVAERATAYAGSAEKVDWPDASTWVDRADSVVPPHDGQRSISPPPPPLQPLDPDDFGSKGDGIDSGFAAARLWQRRDRQLELEGDGEGSANFVESDPAARPRPAASQVRWLGLLPPEFALLEQQGGLLIADLRAVLERIGAQRLELGRSAEAAQRLLLPLTATLPTAVTEAVLADLPRWEALGWELEDFGGGAVLVRAAPAAWPTLESAQLPALFEQLRGPREGLLTRHARLWAAEMLAQAPPDALRGQTWLAELWETDQPYLSPSGRPTVWWISERELNRRFGR